MSLLLVLRSPPSGPPTATAAIAFGLIAAGSTGTAVLNTSFGLNLNSIEIRVNADVGFANKLTGISVGFLSGPATSISTVFDLPATAGFGGATQLTTVFGLSGTVGSTLQGIATPAITFGLTNSPKVVFTANPTIGFTLSGSPITSGGTITPTASTSITFGLNANAAQAAGAALDMLVTLTAIPALNIANLATTMTVSFECDEIRTFFRRG